MKTLQQITEELNDTNAILFSKIYWKSGRAYMEIDYRLADQILPSGSRVFAVIKDGELIDLDTPMYESDLPTGDWKNHIGSRTDITHNFYINKNGVFLNEFYKKIRYHVSI